MMDRRKFHLLCYAHNDVDDDDDDVAMTNENENEVEIGSVMAKRQ